MKNVFQNILDNSEKWDEDTISEADHLLLKLNDFTFMFFLNSFESFNTISSQAGKLFDVLQSKQLDMNYAHEKVNDFIEYVAKHQRDEHYENIVQETKAHIGEYDDADPPARKRSRKELNYKAKYLEIIDNMLLSLRERFAQIQEFPFFELVDVNKFEEFDDAFPTQHVTALQDKYPNIFDCKSLISELKYMYSDGDFKRCGSSNAILELFHKLNLLTAMSETVKLIQLLLTIPVPSVSSERSFSALDRIKSFLRSTMAQENLSSLARISIEKQLLDDLEAKQQLHDKILQEFALKPRRLEFIYK